MSEEPNAGLRKFINSPRNHCFVCSPTNPIGLRLRFERTDGVVHTQFTPSEWHEGWEGIIHGGIIASVLDEAMAYALFWDGIEAVTAKMEIRYKAAVKKGDILEVKATVTRHTRRLVDIDGRITRGGEVVAEASSRFLKLGTLEVGRMDAQE
jgi:acyl-coenzyme A thioesterase PaaI-like protein